MISIALRQRLQALSGHRVRGHVRPDGPASRHRTSPTSPSSEPVGNVERRLGGYIEGFADVSIGLPVASEMQIRHGQRLLIVLIDKAGRGINHDAFRNRTNKAQIGAGVHSLAMSEHPYYQHHYGWNPEERPHVDRIGRQTISLPVSPKLSDADIDRGICAVHLIF